MSGNEDKPKQAHVDHQPTQTQIDATMDTDAQTDLNQMQNDLNEFTKDAPDEKFNLPFGLGKLFNLPGEQQDEQETEAQKSQEEADEQAAQGPQKP